MRDRDDNWTPQKPSIERHPDPENALRCPGYYVATKRKGQEEYEYLVLCEKDHPHRMMIKIDERGHREAVREYGPKSFYGKLLREKDLRP